jgi:hypothetical protein
MELFYQGYFLDQSLGVNDSCLVVMFCFGERRSPFKQAHIRLAQTIPLGHDPLVVAVWKQISRIDRDRLANKVGIGRLLEEGRELRYVQDVVGGGPTDRVSVADDPFVDVRPSFTEVVQQLAQVVTCLRIASLRPERSRNTGPELCLSGMKDEPGNERLLAGRANRKDGEPLCETAKPPRRRISRTGTG